MIEDNASMLKEDIELSNQKTDMNNFLLNAQKKSIKVLKNFLRSDLKKYALLLLDGQKRFAKLLKYWEGIKKERI